MPDDSSSASAPSSVGFLEPLRDQVNRRLKGYLRLDASGPACPAQLREAMEYSLVAGGKRLRPMLVLLSAQACGGGTEAALPAACAVEMVHTYSLIHDDLPAMDDDDLRRGRPTSHKVFGEATAILAGDALLTLAFQLLARSMRPPELAARCCAELAEAAGPCGLVGGQSDDLAAEGGGKSASRPVSESAGWQDGKTVRRREGERTRPPDEQATPETGTSEQQPDRLAELESIHRRKTGALLRVCCRLGGLVAGADPDRLELLDRYGSCIGLAFQITDDLLDARGSEKKTGKRVAKDSARGKLTYPALLGIDESARRARELAGQAVDLAHALGPDGDGLAALARYVLERDR